jgi:predicted dehydrogenase/nucleoside-diphosphate-sugar epimerase
MKSTRKEQLRVAIVGCGAVVERLHLPILQSMDTVAVTLLIDRDQRRLELLAARSPGANVQTKIDGIEKLADVAIVALPHHLHAPVGVSLLKLGLHVFVEKPLAIRTADATALIEAARETGRILAVGQLRRFYETSRYVETILKAGWLGEIHSFDFREGGEYGWPAASPSLFQKSAGGGVLFDTGAHTLDSLVAWLGKAKHVEYADDSRGGVEANCVLKIELESGAKGVVELSRTRNLRNSLVIQGDRGRLEVGPGPRGPVALVADGLRLSGLPEDGTSESGEFLHIARRQFEAFVEAVSGSCSDAVTGQDVIGSIEIFDRCRDDPESLHLEWEPFQCEIDWTQFAGKRILVLGATGFLGHRLVEALKQHTTAEVRVLVRDYSRMSNLSRYEVEIIHGDVADPIALMEASDGCAYVFNCTYGKGDRAEQYRVNVTAVEQLMNSASDSGVSRVIHVSTVSVYGNVAEGVIHEGLECEARRGDVYAHTKLMGEKAVLREGQKRGLDAVVIQPTVVYGPGAPVWTAGQLRLMKQARIGLIDEGAGYCNAVYVDDVVSGLLAAAISPKAVGERILISGERPITWAEFYQAYERVLESKAVELLNEAALIEARRTIRKQGSMISQIRRLLREEYSGRPGLIELPPLAAVRNLVRAIVPRSTIERMKKSVLAAPMPTASSGAAPTREKGLYLPAREQEAFFRAKSTVDGRKARELLGYTPQFSFVEGMARVKSWARWANLT